MIAFILDSLLTGIVAFLCMLALTACGKSETPPATGPVATCDVRCDANLKVTDVQCGPFGRVRSAPQLDAMCPCPAGEFRCYRGYSTTGAAQ